MSQPESSKTGYNSGKVGPPAGLVIMTTNDWKTMCTAFPGTEEFWLPADGRVAPADCLYAQIERKERNLDPSDETIEIRLPDFRRSMVRVSDEYEKQADSVEEVVTGQARFSGEGDANGVPIAELYFYIRIN